MVVLSPPKPKINPYTKEANTYTEKAYTESKVTLASIHNFIASAVPDYSTILNNSNIDSFVANADMNKLILFTDKKTTPLLFKGLSALFYDRLQFGTVFKDEKDIISKFNVFTYPSLILYNCFSNNIIFSDPVIDFYSGDLNASSISQAVEFLALKEKKYITDRKVNNGENIPIKNFGIFYIDSSTFGYYMVRFSEKPAFIIMSHKDTFPIDILKLSRETSGYIMFYYIDCSSDFYKQVVREKYPQMECPKAPESDDSKVDFKLYYFIPFDPKNPVGDGKFEEVIKTNLIEVKFSDYRYLSEFIKKRFPGDVTEVVSEDYFRTIKSIKEDNKIPAVFLHEDESPSIVLNLLSSIPNLNKKIKFISIDFPSADLKNHLKVSKFPRMIIITSNEDKPEQERAIAFQEDMNFSRAKYFLKTFFAESESIKDYIYKEAIDIDYIENNKVFKKLCTSNLKLCVLTFLDGRSLKESQKEFDKHMKTIESIATKKITNKNIFFGWVNAACQKEFANHFDVSIENLPRIVFILPTVSKYAVMYSSFEEENILFSIDNLMKGKVPLFEFNNEKMYLRNSLKCEDVSDSYDLEPESKNNKSKDDL